MIEVRARTHSTDLVMGVFATTHIVAGTCITRHNPADVGSGVGSSPSPSPSPNPSSPQNSSDGVIDACGHFINDAYQPRLDPLHVKISAARYVETAHILANVKLEGDGDDVMVVSVRDIEPGEELLLCFGITYWITRPLRAAVNTRDLELAILYEEVLLEFAVVESALRVERGLSPPPPLIRRTPPVIVVAVDDATNLKKLVVRSTGERPTVDECRRALMWAQVNPDTRQPYGHLRAAMIRGPADPCE
jgi:hypothetical protein